MSCVLVSDVGECYWCRYGLVTDVVSAVDVVCIAECCSCRIGEPDVLLCTFRFSRKYRQCNGEYNKFEGKFSISKV